MKTDYPINLKIYFCVIFLLGIVFLTITCVSLNRVKSETVEYKNTLNERTSGAIRD